MDWSKINVDKLYREYEQLKGLGDSFENKVNTERYNDIETLKFRTEQYYQDKGLLVLCDKACSTDIKQGNVSERIENGKTSIKIVFVNHKGEKGVAVVSLPSTVETNVEILDSMKDLLLDKAKDSVRTNGIYVSNMMNYENTIQNFKRTLDSKNVGKTGEINNNDGVSTKIVGKELVKARMVTETHVGDKLTVLRNGQVEEVVLKDDDIVIVRLDTDRKVMYNEKNEPYRDVLNKQEFEEKFGTFYEKEEYYIAQNNTAIFSLEPDVESNKKTELEVQASRFDEEQNPTKDKVVNLPYCVTDSFEENIKRFAEEMKNVRHDLQLGDNTLCMSDGTIIDPETRKLLGQEYDQELNKTKINELMYKPTTSDGNPNFN